MRSSVDVGVPEDLDAPCPVLSLSDLAATDPRVAGSKAANLAFAASRGLPVMQGFVIAATADPHDLPERELRRALEALTVRPGPLVVRSSSTVEDTGMSSMAGQFASVLGVVGWPAFVDAVATVLASAFRPHDGHSKSQPMAVLVQRQVDTHCAGVLFGGDPVSGDNRRVVVEAVPGTPDTLVGGTAIAEHIVLSRHGRRIGAAPPAARALLSRRRCRRLAKLARSGHVIFGGPQDIEWAFDRGNRLWMLQSRPITARADRPAQSAPVLGPAPVAETFPDPLFPLEVGLWVVPLRDGITRALRLVGAVHGREIDASPIVVTIDGRVAADLELFGIAPRSRRIAQAISPVRAVRRLVVAWRVGRLRASLPDASAALIHRVDAALASVSLLTEASDEDLIDIVEGSIAELEVLHGYEVLAGMLTRGVGDRTSAAGLALDAVRLGHRQKLPAAEIVARWPVVLAIVPPTIGAMHDLPAVDDDGRAVAIDDIDVLAPREALRLRCRWVQELAARAASELGRRLAAAGVISAVSSVRGMSVGELVSAVRDGSAPADLDGRLAVCPGPPLPSAFRLSTSGVPVAVRSEAKRAHGGLPAGGGRAMGRAWHGPGVPRPDGPVVLVVDTLDPRLAAELPRLSGLVCEAGSALAHLAILAREVGVATVVAVPDARQRYPGGTPLVVDGTTGEVRALNEEELP